MRPAINQFPPQLLLDLAVGVNDTYEILESYNLSSDDYANLLANPAFRAQLVEIKRQVAEEGLAFKTKAKMFSEHHLETMDALMNDPICPPATKLGIWQTATKLGGLEPEKKKDEGQQLPTFSLQININ